MVNPPPPDLPVKHEDQALYRARMQYYVDIGQATKNLVENLKRMIKLFDEATTEAHQKYDDSVQKHRMGWDEPAPGPPQSTKPVAPVNRQEGYHNSKRSVKKR